MLPQPVLDAFEALHRWRSSHADPVQAAAWLRAYWLSPLDALGDTLADPSMVTPAELLDRALPALTRSQQGTAALLALHEQAVGDIARLWLKASVARRDVRLAPWIQARIAREGPTAELDELACARVLEGTLVDALACVPLTGSPARMRDPARERILARLEILLWEAGASALSLPHLAPWVFGSARDFDALVGTWAVGPLRGRVLAARCLEVCATGLTAHTDPAVVARVLQLLQPLLLHPDPLVWIHAARALGRFAGEFEALEGTLLDWIRADSPRLRQRAITAFASLRADKLRVFGGELTRTLDEPNVPAWALAAMCAASPYLLHERRDLFDRLAARILRGDAGALGARALARGLDPLWRRAGAHRALVEPTFRALRERARFVRTERLGEQRRWLDVLSITDGLDGAERDPLDLERGLENLARLAAEYDDEEADARAARFAEATESTFQEARRIAVSPGRARHRAAGFNAVEGVARSLALGLWGPLLATRPHGEPVPEPNLESAWRALVDAPGELLALVGARRAEPDADSETLDALEILAIKLGGSALDACGEDRDLGPGRGWTAHRTCLWLRGIDGLTDGSRALSPALLDALASLLWRLVDATRGTFLGAEDDVRWLGPFAAWWALVIDRPAVLEQVASALPMLSPDALERCSILAEEIRGALRADPARACEGRWLETVRRSLAELEAGDTRLASALLTLARALAGFSSTSGTSRDLDSLCLDIVLAAEQLRAALEDPVAALQTVKEDPRAGASTADRLATLMAQGIRGRDPGPVAAWFEALGPVTSALVEAAVTAAIRRTPPPPPRKRAPERKIIGGYELLKPLGEGGIGSVWLVRKPDADRMFVLKIPKSEALELATDSEREGILASFVDEARALAGLYHPNVANIIDRGVAGDVPYLVLEYLIGADLKQYATARPLTLFELRQVVLDACSGLAALHGAGLVHRDIKPANLWVRLPLRGGERFDPLEHRDPARTPVLATVVIDFGMVRARTVSREAMGRFVAGTPGFIAPEQVLDPMELDGRADVYSLAATVYNAVTGRTFFDEIEDARHRVAAHFQRDPLEDAGRLAGFPAAVAKLLREATAKDPGVRPTPLEFGRAFAAAL
jgi:hypothetical protein